jgi:flagellar biogenesis protein FliO
MKNILQILTIILFTSTGNLFSQGEKISPTPNEPVKEINKEPIKQTKLFGSKEHKSSLGITENKNKESGDVMLKTCLSLAAVIGLIVLIFYILKKVNGRIYTNGKNNPMRVFSRLPLDNKNYLTLVRVYEEEFLLSVGPNGSTVVARYALIDQEKNDDDESSPVNQDGKRPFVIDQETHITSINLKPIRDQENENL